MSKYKKNDKVVIRKDLEVDEYYGDWYWSDGKDYLKELDYVVIDKIDDDGYFVKDGDCVIFITDEMIAGLYGEVNGVNIKPKYKSGDKVVIRKDLIEGEKYGDWSWSDEKDYMKKKDYIVIEEVDVDHYWVEEYRIITDKMISHKYEDFNSNNNFNYKELEYVNYKMQHKDLHQSIYNYNLQCQIDKALDENNTELLIELSNLMKGGVMIDN